MLKKFRTAVRHVARSCGYDIVRSGNQYVLMPPAENEAIYNAVKDFTMCPADAVDGLVRAVDYLNMTDIKGDFVECGVWKGGSVMAMNYALRGNKRRLWLYDTFDGMTEPGDEDYNVVAQKHARDWVDIKSETRASAKEVRENMKRSGCYTPNIIIGDVRKTLLIPEYIPDKIALLRLDTDFYDSTKIELEVLYPRLVQGGVLIVDDYTHWRGCRQACEEALGDTILLSRFASHGAVIGVKCSF